jgi:hypothetical protein
MGVNGVIWGRGGRKAVTGESDPTAQMHAMKLE